MSLSCSDSEHDHARRQTKRASHCGSLNIQHADWCHPRPSLQSSGIATPPPSPPSNVHQVKTENEMGEEISRRVIRRQYSGDGEPQAKRRRLSSDQSINRQDFTDGSSQTSPSLLEDTERLAARERCNGRLTRSLTNTRTVFYELGISSATANLPSNEQSLIPNRVTINIPRRATKRKPTHSRRRYRNTSVRLRGSQISGLADPATIFRIAPLTQRKFEMSEERDADDNWRWATQPSSDSEDDWRWKTQSRSPSWEGIG